MVYCGVLSKGCQRCRQRKIKCDQRRPGCMRCEKSDRPCPGYRNLDDVRFRDESDRIIRKARQIGDTKSSSNSTGSQNSRTTSGSSSLTSPMSPVSISFPLSLPITDLGANFFFTKYTFNEPPFSGSYHSWLTQSYLEDGPSHCLRTVIEAVGMAGISNVSHTPQLASKAKEQYCNALAAMKKDLDDPALALADTTFLAAILLGLFETVNFENWNTYQNWAAHIKGATTLLELRGQEQFERELGGQLYVQIRSQILLACYQQHIPVPPGLVDITYKFENSRIRQQWQRRRSASPASMCEISFRMVNLRAAFKDGGVVDPRVLREKALDIEQDLKDWKATAPQAWHYDVVDAGEAAPDTCFEGKRHVYGNIWVGEIWNNWRVLRILVNQILYVNEAEFDTPDEDLKATALSIIHEHSIQICESLLHFANSSRILSLIRPLFVVSLETLNPRNLRSFAIEHLRRIGASMGIRQAGLMADTVSKSLDDPSDRLYPFASGLLIPLVPAG